MLACSDFTILSFVVLLLRLDFLLLGSGSHIRFDLLMLADSFGSLGRGGPIDMVI